MSSIDIVQKGLAAYASGDAQTLAALLTDDMTFSGPVPQPMDKHGFLAVAAGSTAAFPDWDFHGRDWREEGDKVSGTIQVSGTHTGTLAIIPGVPPVPATGKAVQNPPEQITFTVRGTQISAIEVVPTPNGGVPGLYAKVGSPLPHP